MASIKSFAFQVQLKVVICGSLLQLALTPLLRSSNTCCAWPLMALSLNVVLNNGGDEPSIVLTVDKFSDIWLAMWETIDALANRNVPLDLEDPKIKASSRLAVLLH